jgi:hypothetical protein
MPGPRAINPQYQIVKQVQGAIVVNVASLFGNSVQQSKRELPGIVKKIGKAVEDKQLPKAEVRDINMRIARKAQARVVAGWKSRLPAKTKKGSSNRLTGMLGDALKDPANLERTTDRVIVFADDNILSKTAKHWYRVNYGARGPNLGKSTQVPRRFVIQLNGSAFSSFRDERPPSKISKRPYRLYWEDGAMYPGKTPEGKPKSVINKNGARAARFLDLGHAVVAASHPQAMDTTFRDYLKKNGGAALARLQKKDKEITSELRYDRTGWSARTRT